MKLRSPLAITAAVTLIAASPAAAVTITYTSNATVSGIVGGSSVSNLDAVFTGVGDNEVFASDGDVTAVFLTSLQAQIGGMSYAVTDPSLFFINQSDGSGGFSTFFGDSVLTFFADELANFNGLNSFGPVAVTAFNTPFNFATDMGDVSLTDATNVTVSAAAVPEPATWAMMLVGFGAVGGAMRYRRKKVAVSFA